VILTKAIDEARKQMDVRERESGPDSDRFVKPLKAGFRTSAVPTGLKFRFPAIPRTPPTAASWAKLTRPCGLDLRLVYLRRKNKT